MLIEGCCTNEVGFGTKLITNGLRRVRVCAKLVVGDGPPFCGKYGTTPENCQGFSCRRRRLWNTRWRACTRSRL